MVTYVYSVVVGDAVAKALLARLADGANPMGECFFAHGTLSDELEIPRRTLQRKLQYLVAEGFLQIEPRYRPSNGGRSSNLYRILAPSEYLRPTSDEGADAPLRQGGAGGPGQDGAGVCAKAWRSPRAKGGAGYEPSSLTFQSSEEDFNARRGLASSGAHGVRTPHDHDVAQPAGCLPGRWVAVPPELREQVLSEAQRTAGWAVNYLDRCGIDLEARSIHPATAVARGELDQFPVRSVLGRAGLVIGHPLPLAQLQRAIAAGEAAPDEWGKA
ncbi:hypothetical protein [uncultured Phenylobacterium sp.]|uniref:hypothetical protein n=1 Tax=uncultured Phenylobacterium sp. TaxID=349273 RepID=UPI0025DE1962|nr:hypothetical protein [uncultured Phenylobacterium sp.]